MLRWLDALGLWNILNALGGLEDSGHVSELTLQSDQEESILALKGLIATVRTARTAMVESQVRVTRGNAKVERAVRTWREQFRKIKLHLETQTNKRIPLQHPMVPWLVEWAGNITYKYHVGAGSRTGY